MNAITLPLALGFVLIAGLVCWIIATVKGKWWLKLTFILLVPSYGIVLWHDIASHQGWPVDREIPSKSLLLWVDVIEPGGPIVEEGAIHVWVINLGDGSGEDPWFGGGYPAGTPRAYRMAYDRKLHEMLEAAKGRIMGGHPVVLERAPKDAKEGVEGDPGEQFSLQETDYKVYDLPPPALPKKNAQ